MSAPLTDPGKDPALAGTPHRVWVLASSNPGKVREFEQALAPFLAPRGIVLKPQSAFGVVAADEPHASFRDNAIEKARHASRMTGQPALADDSGLVVDLLGGAPGVRSARYWQDARSDAPEEIRGRLDQLEPDEANLRWLLLEVRRVSSRHDFVSASSCISEGACARFQVALAMLRHADDPDPLVVEESWEGRILDAPRGTSGFGYDPVFFDPAAGWTAAEMPMSLKQAIGHRGKAVQQLLSKLEAEGWG